MPETVDSLPQSSAPAGQPWQQWVLNFLLCVYCLLAAISIPLVGWFYAGLGAGLWQRAEDAGAYTLGFGNWHISYSPPQIYWPGLALLLAVVAAVVLVGWLAVRWCRRHYPEPGAFAMRWPVIHAALLAIVLWLFLAKIAAKSADLTVGLYPVLIACACLLLAFAFLVACVLQRLFGWKPLFWYVVLGLYLSSGNIVVVG